MSAYDVCAAISFAIMAALVSLLLAAAALGSVGDYMETRRTRREDEREYGGGNE